MNDVITPRRLLLHAPSGGNAAAIGAELLAKGSFVQADTIGTVDAILLDASDAPDTTPFLDLDDAVFTAQVIDATLERVTALQNAMPRLSRSGSVVVIGSDAHLGHWHATGQGAASAALVGIVRSLAMEYGRIGVRANVIALPLGTTPAEQAVITDAARQAEAMFDSVSITGEAVLLDGGSNLKFRQARRR